MELQQELSKRTKSNVVSDNIREQLLEHAKGFKTSWVSLGQALYSVWSDKLYHAWGYEKFEQYTQRELGIKKQLSVKLLKTYLFLEEDEPDYLKDGFVEEKDAINVPGYEEMNLLRMAKGKKEILKDDYRKLRKDIFEKGKDAGEVRKDLVALMKERKIVDPEEERDRRNEAAIKKLLTALGSFEKDMAALKIISPDLVEEAKNLMDKLKDQIR